MTRLVASQASVISNANNQSQPISWGLNGLGKNIKRFCLRRSFSTAASRASANLCLCASGRRPHTGLAVTATRSHFSEELLPRRSERVTLARRKMHTCVEICGRPTSRWDKYSPASFTSDDVTIKAASVLPVLMLSCLQPQI